MNPEKTTAPDEGAVQKTARTADLPTDYNSTPVASCQTQNQGIPPSIMCLLSGKGREARRE
jgi:hypothetical protein